MKMYGVTAVLVLLLVSGHIGHALHCFSCDFGDCTEMIEKDCHGLDICYTETATTGDVSWKEKGCIDPFKCLAFESSKNYMGFEVKVKRHCCAYHLCN